MIKFVCCTSPLSQSKINWFFKNQYECTRQIAGHEVDHKCQNTSNTRAWWSSWKKPKQDTQIVPKIQPTYLAILACWWHEKEQIQIKATKSFQVSLPSWFYIGNGTGYILLAYLKWRVLYYLDQLLNTTN